MFAGRLSGAGCLRRVCSGLSGPAVAILLAAPLLWSCASDPLGGYTPPTCGNPDVLNYVAAHYSAETQRPEIVPDSAVQFPATPPDTVLCAVYVRRTVYDATRFGGLPKIVIEPRFFHVRTLAHGFEVTFGL